MNSDLAEHGLQEFPARTGAVEVGAQLLQSTQNSGVEYHKRYVAWAGVTRFKDGRYFHIAPSVEVGSLLHDVAYEWCQCTLLRLGQGEGTPHSLEECGLYPLPMYSQKTRKGTRFSMSLYRAGDDPACPFLGAYFVAWVCRIVPYDCTPDVVTTIGPGGELSLFQYLVAQKWMEEKLQSAL